jgi:uncharacterized protein
VIVLDTSVLVYAVGADHPLAGPCKRLLDAVAAGAVVATTIVEVVQEFTHVRSRRRGRADAAALARDFARVLAPLLVVDENTLERAIRLFERHERLDAFDALLAAAALEADAEALVSADRAFAGIRGLRYVDPTAPALDRLLA